MILNTVLSIKEHTKEFSNVFYSKNTNMTAL